MYETDNDFKLRKVTDAQLLLLSLPSTDRWGFAVAAACAACFSSRHTGLAAPAFMSLVGAGRPLPDATLDSHRHSGVAKSGLHALLLHHACGAHGECPWPALRLSGDPEPVDSVLPVPAGYWQPVSCLLGTTNILLSLPACQCSWFRSMVTSGTLQNNGSMQRVSRPCPSTIHLQVNLESGPVESSANLNEIHDALHINFLRVCLQQLEWFPELG